MDSICVICKCSLPPLPEGSQNLTRQCNRCFETESRLQISNKWALLYFKNRIDEILGIMDKSPHMFAVNKLEE